MNSKDWVESLKGSYLFALVFAVILGFLIFSQYAEPKIGVIKLTGTIDERTTDQIVSMLRYAKESDDIKAVVLRISSPGGSASLSEEIYLTVLSLKEEKPIIASMDQMGASGAYFSAIGANLIYAKPTSIVGSVGVVTALPRPIDQEENSLTSGPLKELGTTRREWAYQAKQVADTFINSVILERGDKLKLTREEISSAGLYVGLEAKKNGLVDELGSTEDAISTAAELAGIRRYSVVDINEELGIQRLIFPFKVNSSIFEGTNTAPVHYYIYVERGDQ
ncbi:MAG: S49 family peptidase [Candidatus Hydrothermarchaeales archaeon]